MRYSLEKRLRTPPVISRYFSGEGQADTLPPAPLAATLASGMEASTGRP